MYTEVYEICVYRGMHNTCGDICIQRYMRFVYIGVCTIRVEILYTEVYEICIYRGMHNTCGDIIYRGI